MKYVLAHALVAGFVLVGAAHAVDVYKWKDSQGVVHYGDHPPAASAASASLLSVPGNGMTAAEEDAAEERLARVRAQIGAPSGEEAAQEVRPQGRHRVRSATCADAWKQYDDAAACFSRNRVTDNGKGVTATGAAVCKELPQPGCPR
jgi:hypothetical protein